MGEPQVGFIRTADYRETYANSIILEQTAWDLKMTFGMLDGAAVNQNLGISIPWPQAKLMLFWLRLQVESAEATVGVKIPLRSDILPPEPSVLTPEQEADPTIRRFQDLYVKLREEFLKTI